MAESIRFHTDLYRRDALQVAAQSYERIARIELDDDGAHVVARLEPLADGGDARAVCDAFCTEAFSSTVRRLRDLASADSGDPRSAPEPASTAPAWGLLKPLHEGIVLGLGWAVESLSPIRGGSATLALRHPDLGIARVAIHRNEGAPLGVAHTDHLDFMLMNGGSGTTQTDESIGRILVGLARALQSTPDWRPDDDCLRALRPHAERQVPAAVAAPVERTESPRRVFPSIDLDEGTVSFDFDEAGVSRLALYDAVLPFTDRCHVFLTRPDAGTIGVRLRTRADAGQDLRAIAAEMTRALNGVLRNAAVGFGPTSPESYSGLPPLPRRQVDMPALLAELAAGDAATMGLGAQPERGPGHEGLRVMNILGTGACNSDCLFCCEKFNPSNRLMPSADATRKMILDGAGEFDMLFLASGEPTIHPKLFEYVELAKSVGFTSFGMSSHFRTFADPHFALKTLQAGFEFFDISLHAADIAGQLDVNPIGDDGDSLFEALKGLAIMYRLADALGIRISVTHKIVVSRLNVTRLEQIFRATYDRGVRHFILQPVRTLGLAPERQAALAISEAEILPYLNDLLRGTQGLGAVLKPYGFSRGGLFAGEHIEYERNRIKNVSGKQKTKRPRALASLPQQQEERPADGRHWVEVRTPAGDRFGFAVDGGAPILDEALRRAAHLPFGCRMGSCGMCCGFLLDGKVDQSTQHFLSGEQMRQGYVLLCQARPRSDVVVRVCTDDEIDPL